MAERLGWADDDDDVVAGDESDAEHRAWLIELYGERGLTDPGDAVTMDESLLLADTEWAFGLPSKTCIARRPAAPT